MLLYCKDECMFESPQSCGLVADSAEAEPQAASARRTVGEPVTATELGP